MQIENFKCKLKRSILGKELGIIFIIFAIGAALRFYNLSYRSLWLDEAWRIATSKIPIADLLSGKAEWTINLFGFLILRGVNFFFGDSEFTMRLLPAIAGSLLPIFTFYLGKKIFGIAEGLIASLLVAISPISVAYSQECASYSLWMLSVATYLLAFLCYVETDSHKWLSGYIFFVLLSNYFHVYNMFIQFSLCAYYTFINRKNIKPIIRFYCINIVIVFLSLPAVYSVYHGMKAGENYYAGYSISISQVIGFLYSIIMSWISGSTTSIYVPQAHFGTMTEIKMIFNVLVHISAGYALFFGIKNTYKKNVFLLFVILIPVFFVVCISSLNGFFFERYVLPILPVFFIILAAGLNYFQVQIFRNIGLINLVFISSFFLLVNFQNNSRLLWKNDWRPACHKIDSDVSLHRDNYAILVPMNFEVPLVSYYCRSIQGRILKDEYYHSFLYNHKYAYSSYKDIKKFNLELLSSANNDNVKRIYVITISGMHHLDYIDNYMKFQKATSKTIFDRPIVKVYCLS